MKKKKEISQEEHCFGKILKELKKIRKLLEHQTGTHTVNYCTVCEAYYVGAIHKHF